MDRVEIKVSCFPSCILIISRILNWCKVINLHIIRNNNNSSRVLSCCSFNTGSTMRKPILFCSPKLLIRITFISLNVTIGSLIGNSTNRPSTKDILFTEQHFHVVMSNRLIVPREVQINIWNLISLKP